MERWRAMRLKAVIAAVSLVLIAVIARIALVRDGGGKAVRRAAEIANGAQLDIEFADGHRSATADEAAAKPAIKAVAPARKKTSQGSLF